MKKSMVAIFGIGILLYPLICFSSYVIHLKDGRKVVVDQYWEEGEQIKFKKCGGIMGIQKDLVKEIEEKEDLPEEKAEVVKPETEKQEVTENTTKAEVARQGGTAGEERRKDREQIKEQEKKEKSAEEEKKSVIEKYTKKFNLINEKFKDVQMMSSENLYKFVDELITFKKGVLSNRLAGIFSKHLIEIYSMLDEVEAILKFRGD